MLFLLALTFADGIAAQFSQIFVRWRLRMTSIEQNPADENGVSFQGGLEST